MISFFDKPDPLFGSWTTPDKIVLKTFRHAITAIHAPNATDVAMIACNSLATIDAPYAIQASASACPRLTKFRAPNAHNVNVQKCDVLSELDVFAAGSVYVFDCQSLAKIFAPKACEIIAHRCAGLMEIDAPNAARVDVEGCISLRGYQELGDDARGYEFRTFQVSGIQRIYAEHLYLTIPEALAHWGPNSPHHRADCYALVLKAAEHK